MASVEESSRGRWRLLHGGGSARSGPLVRAADAFVSRLGLRHDAGWADLQRAVEAVYGKPIVLIASTNPGLQAITGLWFDTATFGAVVCRASDDPHYQAQNALHELAHILLSTAPEDWFSPELPRLGTEPADSPTLLCAYTAEQTVGQTRREAAVEEVAFSLARAIQSVNRSSEEAYFG